MRSLRVYQVTYKPNRAGTVSGMNVAADSFDEAVELVKKEKDFLYLITVIGTDTFVRVAKEANS